jgi:O-antigen/teichoic acid export membrane protein
MTKKLPYSSSLNIIVKGATMNIWGAISRNLLNFIFVLILSKVLSPKEMGIFFLAINIILFISVIAIAGLDVGMRRFIAIANSANDNILAWSYFYTAAIIFIPLSCCLMSLTYLLSDLFASILSKPELSSVIKCLAPYVFFYSATEIFLSVTQAHKKMKYWVICLDLLNNALKIMFAITFSLMGFLLIGISFGYVLSIIITFMFSFYFFKKVMPRFKRTNINYKFRELVPFAFPSLFARIINSSAGIFETVLLGFFLLAADIGIYTVSLKIVLIGNIVLASFNTIFSPIISQLHYQHKNEELKQLYSVVTRWTFQISLPIFMLVAWFSVHLLTLFGEEYASGSNVTVILCLGQIANAVTGPSGNILLMSGRGKLNLSINAFGLISSLTLIVLSVPSYGMEGCAIALGLSIALTNTIRILSVYKIWRMHPYGKEYWKPIASALCVIIILNIIGPSRSEAISIFSLILTFLIGCIIYCAFTVCLGLDETDKYMFTRLKQRLLRDSTARS